MWLWVPARARKCSLGRDDRSKKMSPELTFIALLGVRMAVAAAFVVSASFIAERAGPAIGALVATLPVSAGPAYVFLALDHDAAFIAQGALASLPINAATAFLGLVYVLLAQRQNVLVSCSVAVATWFALAALMRALNLSLMGGLIANAAAFAICVPALQRFRHVRMPLIARRWYDIPLRASMVAALVATVVALSGWVGPSITGILALFPVVFTSLMLILHPRIGGPATAAVIANSAWGLMGFGLAIAVLMRPAWTTRPSNLGGAKLENNGSKTLENSVQSGWKQLTTKYWQTPSSSSTKQDRTTSLSSCGLIQLACTS